MKNTEIVRNHPRATRGNWRKLLAHAIRDPDELCTLLELPDTIRAEAHRAARDFPLIVPRHFVDLIERGNPNDPLLLQILPLHAETVTRTGCVDDPTHDADFCTAPGVLKKYPGRALLVTTRLCAINCRYCFRRHFAYDDLPQGPEDWSRSLTDIDNDTSISEVILSGGDPLCMTDESLRRLLDAISEMNHIRRLRVHSRMPIVLPERITDDLLDVFCPRPFQTILVIHANHPRELSESCRLRLKTVQAAGILMLNQSVLLKGINDDADTLEELSECLIRFGVVPYYLHQLDRVRGASHFEVTVDEGLDLMDELRRRLPGYAVPQYVREDPGQPSKTPLFRY